MHLTTQQSVPDRTTDERQLVAARPEPRTELLGYRAHLVEQSDERGMLFVSQTGLPLLAGHAGGSVRRTGTLGTRGLT